MISMLKDEILEKILANKEMHTIPIGTQTTAISVFEQVLDELKEVNQMSPYQNYYSNQMNPYMNNYQGYNPMMNAQQRLAQMEQQYMPQN